jgi:CRISPR-associated endonuclease/helicase Cas3
LILLVQDTKAIITNSLGAVYRHSEGGEPIMDVNQQACRRSKEIEEAMGLARLLAEAGGYSHDVGKAGSYFVEKLNNAAKSQHTSPDPARHEWVSMKALEQILEGESPHAALSQLTPGVLRESPPLSRGACGLIEALLFICGSHHRLFGPAYSRLKTSLAKLDNSNHVQDFLPPFVYPVTKRRSLSKAFTKTESQRIEALRSAVSEIAHDEAVGDEPFWYGLAWYSRVALILADHGVSAQVMGIKDEAGQRKAIPSSTPGLYANTWPKHIDTSDSGGYNQPLEVHLTAVAAKAGEIADAMWRMALAGLEAGQVDSLLTPVQGHYAQRFVWQDEAVEAIRQHRKISEAPLLVFNVASTGAGKTVMNIKAACAAALGSPRLSYALNLRSLTLQTGDALERDLGLGQETVATVIGDQVAVRLHESEQTAADPQEPIDSGDADSQAIKFDAVGGIEDLPDWLAPITEKRPEWRRILASPVLVSTVDFLVQAGEPGQQGQHAAAYLRLMHSDLILDEVDSYGAESLIAILRLIHVAASLGRNVVCSSATLPWPIANAIAEAYQSGHEVWSALHRQPPTHDALVITDAVSPRWIKRDLHFADSYKCFLKLQSEQRLPVTKKVSLQTLNFEQGIDGLLSAVGAGVERLHGAHQWPCGKTHKPVSFGLVRVANIQTANKVAEYLGDQPGTLVCLYHARDFTIQRHLKERALDRLLSRKQGNNAIEHDAEIQAACVKSDSPSLRFVVVATPVEEIGRDHDFDWAVIEPSGSHSIVQTAGRVNRHRRVEVRKPNIAILQFNARALRKKETVIFTHPGPEGSESFRHLPRMKTAYPDLAHMLDWSRLDQLTAAMAFDDKHPLVEGEICLQEKLLDEPMKVLKRERPYENIWMTSRFYGKYPLRGGNSDHLEDWRVLPVNGGERRWERLERVGYAVEYVGKRAPTPDMKETNWLSWDIEALWGACQPLGVSLEDGMRIKILDTSKKKGQ